MPVQVNDDRIIDALLSHSASAVLAHSKSEFHQNISDHSLGRLIAPDLRDDLGLLSVSDFPLLMLNIPRVTGQMGIVLWHSDFHDVRGRKHPRALIDLRRGSGWLADVRRMRAVLATQHGDTTGFKVNLVTGSKTAVDAWMGNLDMQMADSHGAVTSCYTVPPTPNPYVAGDEYFLVYFLVAVLPVNRL